MLVEQKAAQMVVQKEWTKGEMLVAGMVEMLAVMSVHLMAELMVEMMVDH
jgi:hypothetical protein